MLREAETCEYKCSEISTTLSHQVQVRLEYTSRTRSRINVLKDEPTLRAERVAAFRPDLNYGNWPPVNVWPKAHPAGATL
jgi:hypothetical protein